MRATYNLEHIKELVSKNCYRITVSASNSAYLLGFDEDDIIRVIKNLTFGDFYKTMPAKLKQGFWQDVYHREYEGMKLYIKLQIVSEVIIISFKEK